MRTWEVATQLEVHIYTLFRAQLSCFHKNVFPPCSQCNNKHAFLIMPLDLVVGRSCVFSSILWLVLVAFTWEVVIYMQRNIGPLLRK